MTSPVGIESSLLLGATPHGTGGKNLEGRSVEEVAREFEAMLVTQLIGAMRKTIGESGLLEASPQRKVFDGVFDNEMARSLVDGGGLGLAESLAQQLRKNAMFAEPATAGQPLPVDGEISSGFGPRIDPFSGEQHFHAGIDVAAPEGADIRSVRDGVVVFSGERGAGGNTIEIRHTDGSVAAYAHADTLLREVGDSVRSGETVATVGSTGRSTGPHLHFSVRQGGAVVNPTPWLAAGNPAVDRTA